MRPRATDPPQAPFASKSSTSRTRTLNHVPVDIRYVELVAHIRHNFLVFLEVLLFETLTCDISDLPILLQQHQNPQRRRSMPKLSPSLR
jgi:hypothetical protein